MRVSRARRWSGLLTTLVTAFTFLGATTAVATTDSEASSEEYSVSRKDSCFGYTGTFNEDDVLYVDWSQYEPECFGVAPSGTIWHTWAGAGGWHEMPGNGRAAAIKRYYDYGDSGYRSIVVMTESSTLWEQYYRRGSGWSGHWSECC